MGRINRSKAQRKSTRNHFPLGFRPLLLAVASALSLNAWAQDQSDTEGAQGAGIEEIVVTGFRGSLMEAMRLKMESEQIIEAISAEELGKLPDNSIAEALTRLPGLAGERDLQTGRQQNISIRGLSGNFATALLNGQQQVSASLTSRSVQFDQYPSELLSSVVVYKTPSASLSGQGLSGTVDMQTVRPLDFGEPAIAGNVRYEWNDKPAANPDGESRGQRYTISYIDQFDNEKVGFAVGYAGVSAPTQSDSLPLWNWGNPDIANANVGLVTPPLALRGFASQALSVVLERDSVMGVLEFRPSERTTHVLDVFYSQFEEHNVTRLAQTVFNIHRPPTGMKPDTLGPNPVVDAGRVVGGTYENLKLTVVNTDRSTDAQLGSFAWTSEFELSDAWSAEIKLNTSVIDHSQTEIQSRSATGRGREGARDTLAFTINDVGLPTFSGVLDYTAPGVLVLTNPAGNTGGAASPGGAVGWYNVPATDDEISQVRAAAQRTLNVGGLSDIHFGVQTDQRSKVRDHSQAAFIVMADGMLTAPIQAIGSVQLPWGFPAIAAYDARAVFDSGIYELERNLASGVLANNYSVDEQLLMAFLEFGVDSTLFDVPVTGNFGVRIINTDQSSTGSRLRNANNIVNRRQGLVSEDFTDGATYTDYLPSMNLNFAVAEGKVVRLGIARALARAPIHDMRASQSINFNATRADSTDVYMSPWGGNGGNPLLRPWISNQIDLSYEHYFSESRGYWAVAAYYKDLESYIFQDELLVDFSGFPTDPVPVLSEGIVNRPQNGMGGELYGVEFSLQIPGEMLTPALTGFGAVLNASATDSSIIVNPRIPEARLPGLSEEVVNTTLYYERFGFSARVSSTFRSDFIVAVGGLGGINNQATEAEQIVSAQVGYNFRSGSLAGLNVFLQGQNLTDRIRHLYFERDPRLASRFSLYGRTFLLGASYRL